MSCSSSVPAIFKIHNSLNPSFSTTPSTIIICEDQIIRLSSLVARSRFNKKIIFLQISYSYFSFQHYIKPNYQTDVKQHCRYLFFCVVKMFSDECRSLSPLASAYMPAGLSWLIYRRPACTSRPKDKSRDSFRCQAMKQLLTGFLFSNRHYPS